MAGQNNLTAPESKIFPRRNWIGRIARRRLTCAMRLHDRYLFRELLLPLAGCLGAFMIFWVSIFFFTRMDEMRKANLHFLDTMEFAGAELVAFFVLVLPFTLLLALLYALTQHARHNELTALRAAGVSIWRLCVPYFCVGLAASGIYFALNELAVPRCEAWSREILARHGSGKMDPKTKTVFKGSGFSNQRTGRVWQFGEYNAVTTEIVNPNIVWTRLGGAQKQLLWADRGRFTNGVWTFFNNVKVFTQTGDKGRLVPQIVTNQLALPEFTETPREVLIQLKFSDTQMLTGSRNADIPLAELWEYLRYNPGLSGQDTGRLLTKFHGRLAAPWTCLVVVFIAIPFGAASGRRNLFFGVAGSIFIGLTFFVLQQTSLALGAGGTLPGWLAAWLPNIFFATAGIGLTWRTR